MKILWLVNIVMPELAVHLGSKPSVFGGWLSGALEAVRKSGNALVIVMSDSSKKAGKYEVNGITYYITASVGIPGERSAFREILDVEKPDVVHIYGTEFEQSWAMAQEADVERTVVTIQGPLVYYKDAVYGELPERVCRDTWLHKLLRKLNKGGQSIELQRVSFAQRAELERKTLQRLKYIHGGSEWGNAVARSVHPGCTTFDGGLILRTPFYGEERWSWEACEKHNIYVLFSYPIKGFHQVLEALPIVLERFPDTKVHVVSSKLKYRRYTGLRRVIMNKAPDYQWYIQQRVEELGLKEHLIFEGYLNAEQVKARLLKTHVFVSAAKIENQCTALGEALILGVPCVASFTGAIPETVEHGKSGFLYPFDSPYMLADSICKIFSDRELAERFSEMGRRSSARTYDPEKNGELLLEMYRTIDHNAKENIR